MANKKRFKKFITFPLFSLLFLLFLVVVIAIVYVGYVSVSYYRIGNITVDPANNQTETIQSSDIGTKEFQIVTYNVGFGAYDRDYSFFMDESRFKEEYIASQGSKSVSGTHAQGANKDRVLANTNGALSTIDALDNVDFLLYQELDFSDKSTRTHGVDQLALADLKHDDYARVFGVNYHSAFLFYPFHEPIGSSNSGLATYSKYNISKAERKEFTITSDFFGKFFDLDRAFTISTMPISGTNKNLYVFNVHMSAYDESGAIRKVQLQELKAAISAARDLNGKNNYVVVGGDFNHDLLIDNPLYSTDYKDTIFNKQETDILSTDWYNYFRLNEALDGTTVPNLITGIDEEYTYDFVDLNVNIYGPTNLATCRDAALPFGDRNSNDVLDNSLVTIDGYIVSDNINVTDIETIGSGPNGQSENLLPENPGFGQGFVYSDHNPVLMKFILN